MPQPRIRYKCPWLRRSRKRGGSAVVQGRAGVGASTVSDEARALELRPEPTGASHEVAPTEMFFSTTDQRGVITDANSVFVRLSRYPLPSLLNAPHSIIRHPDMPGGAFEVMWQTLNAVSYPHHTLPTTRGEH